LLCVFPQANAARLNQRRARSSPLNEFYLTIIFTAGMRHLAASGLNAGRLVGWSAGALRCAPGARCLAGC
jgi:hypothetical protein